VTQSDSDRLELTAVVLAGGRSERMGTDKTLLDVGGKPLVVRVVEAVGEVCERTLIVTNLPEALAGVALPADVTVLRDEVAYQGPLGGIVTALAEAGSGWLLVAAADMPHVEPQVIRALWELREDADAVVPVSEKGLEPLLALYRVEACLPVARSVLAEGRRRPDAIFPQVRTVHASVGALRAADPELRSFVNVNTPTDLASVRAAEGEDLGEHGGK
jgi:molybdopterin-guanine dinucleotide biosynthesis protein A